MTNKDSTIATNDNNTYDKRWVRKRGALKQKMTYLERYVDTIKSSTLENRPGCSEIELKIAHAETILQEFSVTQAEIESTCDE